MGIQTKQLFKLESPHIWKKHDKSSLFYRYYFVKYLSELAELLPLPHFRGSLTRYSEGSMDFLPPSLNIVTMITNRLPQVEKNAIK